MVKFCGDVSFVSELWSLALNMYDEFWLDGVTLEQSNVFMLKVYVCGVRPEQFCWLSMDHAIEGVFLYHSFSETFWPSASEQLT